MSQDNESPPLELKWWEDEKTRAEYRAGIELDRAVDKERKYVPRKRFDLPPIEGVSPLTAIQRLKAHAQTQRDRAEAFRQRDGLQNPVPRTQHQVDLDAKADARMDYRFDVQRAFWLRMRNVGK